MTMKSLVTLGMLSSLALLLFTVVPTYSQSGDAVVIIDQSVGGTSNPGPGTHTYPGGVFVYLTAIPSPGYQFDHWEYLGPFEDPGYHGGNLVFNTPTVQFNCAGGFTVEWQAVFVPTA